MNSNIFERMAGWVLLTVGLLLIIVPLYQTYAIFTGHSVPAQVFKMQPAPVIDKNANPFDVQKQVENAVAKMVPWDLINNTLNLACWVGLMFILIYGGKQIASIGLSLIKNSHIVST